ncbi:hypothetical protein SRHO_G00244230 [Serrasalmus rhombeus]
MAHRHIGMALADPRPAPHSLISGLLCPVAAMTARFPSCSAAGAAASAPGNRGVTDTIEPIAYEALLCFPTPPANLVQQTEMKKDLSHA